MDISSVIRAICGLLTFTNWDAPPSKHLNYNDGEENSPKIAIRWAASCRDVTRSVIGRFSEDPPRNGEERKSSKFEQVLDIQLTMSWSRAWVILSPLLPMFDRHPKKIAPPRLRLSPCSEVASSFRGSHLVLVACVRYPIFLGCISLALISSLFVLGVYSTVISAINKTLSAPLSTHRGPNLFTGFTLKIVLKSP